MSQRSDLVFAADHSRTAARPSLRKRGRRKSLILAPKKFRIGFSNKHRSLRPMLALTEAVSLTWRRIQLMPSFVQTLLVLVAAVTNRA